MNDFVRRLPWRLGALGGLVVGAISLAGQIDLWVCLLRAGAAFAVFGVLGMGVRAGLEAGTAPPGTRHPPARKGPDAPRAETGTHVDQKTPPMTAGDLPPPDDRPPGSN